MANNRLFIVDTETGERIMLAKSNGDGWWMWYKDDKARRVDEITEWLGMRDLNASFGNTDDQPSRLVLMTENEPAYLELIVEINNCPTHGSVDKNHRCPQFDGILRDGWTGDVLSE